MPVPLFPIIGTAVKAAIPALKAAKVGALARKLPSIISGGTQLASQALNASAVRRANKQQLDYNKQMYQQQRKDSLSDWEMQNKYGSPQQQMQRLSEAGLNPHLVYGKGTIDNFAGAVRSTDVKQYSPEAVRMDIGQTLSAYADLELKRAQTDNLRSSIETSAEQRALIAAQALRTAKETDNTVFRTMRDSLLLPGSLEAQRASLKKTDAEIRSILDSNDRAAAKNSSDLKEAVERILSSREQRAKTVIEKEQLRQLIKNLNQDSQLKQFDINLKQQGVQPTDNILFRAAAQFLGQGKYKGVTDWYNKNYTPSGWKKK